MMINKLKKLADRILLTGLAVLVVAAFFAAEYSKELTKSGVSDTVLLLAGVVFFGFAGLTIVAATRGWLSFFDRTEEAARKIARKQKP